MHAFWHGIWVDLTVCITPKYKIAHQLRARNSLLVFAVAAVAASSIVPDDTVRFLVGNIRDFPKLPEEWAASLVKEDLAFFESDDIPAAEEGWKNCSETHVFVRFLRAEEAPHGRTCFFEAICDITLYKEQMRTKFEPIIHQLIPGKRKQTVECRIVKR